MMVFVITLLQETPREERALGERRGENEGM
jgi:hypothetical protein